MCVFIYICVCMYKYVYRRNDQRRRRTARLTDRRYDPVPSTMLKIYTDR